MMGISWYLMGLTIIVANRDIYCAGNLLTICYNPKSCPSLERFNYQYKYCTGLTVMWLRLALVEACRQVVTLTIY